MALPFPLDQFSPTSHVIDTASMTSVESSGALTHARKLVEEKYNQAQSNRRTTDANESEEVIPHHLTFSAVWNWHLKYYYTYFDESQIDSIQNSIAMRRDGFIQELLWHRQLPTVCLPHSIECDDPDDPRQTAIRKDLTQVVNRLPYLQRMKLQLLEALFYGKSGVQTIWGRKKIGQRDYTTVVNHQPVNGDKIVYDWDGTPGIFIYQGSSQFNEPKIQQNVKYCDRGPALFLRDQFYRDRFIIHEFQPTDTDYLFESEKAAAVHGLGIRDRFYWTWNMRAQVLDWYLNAIERVGANGMLYAYYPSGNYQQRNAVMQALKDFISTNVAAFPRSMGDKDPVINKIDPSPVGYDVMYQLLQHLEEIMRRGVLGQTLSTKAGATGLGSGVADLQGESKEDITIFDSTCLAECLNEQLIQQIICNNVWDYGGQMVRGDDLPFTMRLIIQTDRQNIADMMNSAHTLWEMGVALDSDDVRDRAGFKAPRSKATTLVQMGGAGVGITPNAEAVASSTGETETGGHQLVNNLPATAGKDEVNKAPLNPNPAQSPGTKKPKQPDILTRLLGDKEHKGREHYDASSSYTALQYELANFDPSYLRGAFWDRERGRAWISIFLSTPIHELNALKNALTRVLGPSKFRVVVEQEPTGARWTRVDLSGYEIEPEWYAAATPLLLGGKDQVHDHELYEDVYCPHCSGEIEKDKDGKRVFSEHRCYSREDFSASHEGENPGVMIALMVPGDIAGDISIAGGEEPDSLHVTLAYLGRVSEIESEDLARILELCPLLAEAWRPLVATVGGVGRFSASESSDGKDVVYASIDSNDITEFRQDLCEVLSFARVSYKKDHGFTPHITLKYVDEDSDTPVRRINPKSLTFNKVALVIGGKATEYELGSPDLISA